MVSCKHHIISVRSFEVLSPCSCDLLFLFVGLLNGTIDSYVAGEVEKKS